jgi:uroporphyrinogen-III synthase
VVYESHPVVPEALEVFKGKLRARQIDAVTFCAPSAVAALEQALEGSLASLRETRVVSIGPTTSAALTRAGLPRVAQAAASTGEALTLAILRCLTSAPREAAR